MVPGHSLCSSRCKNRNARSCRGSDLLDVCAIADERTGVYRRFGSRGTRQISLRVCAWNHLVSSHQPHGFPAGAAKAFCTSCTPSSATQACSVDCGFTGTGAKTKLLSLHRANILRNRASRKRAVHARLEEKEGDHSRDPDIILFLVLPEEAASRFLPPVRPLAAILEESTDSGSPSATLPRVEDAPPPPSLSPRLLPDTCDGAGRAGLGVWKVLRSLHSTWDSESHPRTGRQPHWRSFTTASKTASVTATREPICTPSYDLELLQCATRAQLWLVLKFTSDCASPEIFWTGIPRTFIDHNLYRPQSL